MGEKKREQSHWNLPRGSQLAMAGPGVMQSGCHSYRMGMMEGLSFFFLFFSVCCLFNTSFPTLVYTSVSQVSHSFQLFTDFSASVCSCRQFG